MTVDLSLDYFQVLQGWLSGMRVGRAGYTFVVSGTGTFLSHPDARCELPRKITDFNQFQDDVSLKGLLQQMQGKEEGRVAAVDPWNGRPAAFHFAPIPSAGWSLAVVIQE